MGINHLMEIVREKASGSLYINHLQKLKGKKLAFDLSVIAHQRFREKLPSYIEQLDEIQNGHPWSVDWESLKKSWISNILEYLFLLSSKVSLILIFDGQPTSLKNIEQKQRKKNRERKKEILENLAKEYENAEGFFHRNNSLDKYRQAFINAVTFRYDFLDALLECCTACGFSVMKSIEESDILIASLAKEEKIEGVFSTDTDLLVYGVPILVFKFSSAEIQYIILEEFLEESGLTQETLIELAILLGCDYNHGVPGYGKVRAFDFITQYGQLEFLPSKAKRRFLGVRKLRNRFSNIPESEKLIDTSFVPSRDNPASVLTKHGCKKFWENHREKFALLEN